MTPIASDRDVRFRELFVYEMIGVALFHCGDGRG